ncbi:MAG: hypothetical protein AAF741_18820 [Bacteroidota bacterium]
MDLNSSKIEQLEGVLRVLQDHAERGGYRSGKKTIPYTPREKKRLYDRIVSVRQQIESLSNPSEDLTCRPELLGSGLLEAQNTNHEYK